MKFRARKFMFMGCSVIMVILMILMGCNPGQFVGPAVVTETPTLIISTNAPTDVPTEIPLPSTPLMPTNTQVTGCIELLKQPWRLEGTGPQEAYEHETDPSGLMGKSIIRITYDLHGLNALPEDASALIFDQPFGGAWHYISLSDYGRNGFDGLQTIDIALSAFTDLDLEQPVGTLHTRFWHTENYLIEIVSVMACS